MRRPLALLPLALPSSAPAAEPGVHSDNMSYVKNILYPAKNGGTANYGTDIEFATLAGRQYAFAGYASDTYGDGTSTCYREAAALGFDVLKADGTGKNGTFIAEITNPFAPTTSRASRRRTR